MQIVDLSLNVSTVSVLLGLINLENNQNLALSDLIFADPVVGSTISETKVTVTPSDASNLMDEVVFTYERVDIGQYFDGAAPTLYIGTTPVTKALILAAMLDQYQIFSDTDVHNDFTVVIHSSGLQATITPKATNYVWIGSLIVIISVEASLASVLTVNALTGFTFPANQSVNCPNALPFYGLVSGVNMRNELQELQSGDNYSVVTASWPIGTELLQEPWTISQTPGPFNLFGSIVRYNGPATGAYQIPTSYGTWPGWVCVIALGSACTNRCGQLVFVYEPNLGGGGSPPPPPTDPNQLYI